MKIVLIGGGSYVFAPTVIEDLVIKHQIDECELVLVDINKDAVETMGKAAKKLALEKSAGLEITWTTDRKKALQKADYVIVCAAIQGKKRWQMDYRILKEMGLDFQARENGGIGGLCYSLRSITLLLNICRDMEEVCPKALLLSVTNPLPQVITAINKYTAIKGVGFCNIAWRGVDGYRWVSNMLGKAPKKLNVVSAGLNHFSWLVEVRERKTGKDLLPVLIDKIVKNQGRKYKVMARWYREFGAVIAGVVDHHGEFLPHDPDVDYKDSPPFHGNNKERKQLVEGLKAVAAGKISWSKVEMSSSWEHPVDLAIAREKSKITGFDMVNIPNQGYIPELPEGNIVEVPARVNSSLGVEGKVIGKLPEKVIQICRKISRVHQLTARAAVKGDREVVRKVIESDPAVNYTNLASKALDKMLAAHEDLLPQFK